MHALNWSDADEIGFQLSEKFPDLDPLTVRFEDLRQRVMDLENFDDTAASSENILEAIQMAWLEYHGENH